MGRTVLVLLAAAILASASPPSVSAGTDAPAASTSDPYKNIPLRRDADEPGMAWVYLAAMAGLGAVIVVLARNHRRSGQGWPRTGSTGWPRTGAAGQRVQVIERRGLQAGCTLYLVRWDDEEVLLGCTAHAVNVIAQRPLAPAPRTET